MDRILWGNAISLLGAVFMVASGLAAEQESVLRLQCVQFTAMAAGNLLLGGITGCISGVVSIARDLACFYIPYIWPCKLAFCAVQTLLAAAVSGTDWISWLPILAAVLFTCLLDTRSPLRFKAVVIVCQLLWSVYDLSLQNYVAAAFDGFTILSNLCGGAGILLDRRRKRASCGQTKP